MNKVGRSLYWRATLDKGIEGADNTDHDSVDGGSQQFSVGFIKQLL